jgi:antirestriction protein
MINHHLDHASLSTIQEPKIYVACLSSYTSGISYGAWIDATQLAKDIWAQIKQLLANSPMPGAEEFAVHDFQGFGSLHIDEYEGLKQIHEKATFVVEHGQLGAELAAYYGNLEEAEEALENHYMGAHESDLDYAIHLFDECYLHNIPESIQYYVDYDKFCRDIFIDDYFSIDIDGKTHVFVRH